MLAGKILFIFSFVSICEGFFTIDVSKVNNLTISRSNLNCSYNNDFNSSNCEYCVYQFFSNGSFSNINKDCITVTNSYKDISGQCDGFSDQRDIGYGVCPSTSFDMSDVSILCICGTNMCNTDLTTCRSSVDYQIETKTVPAVLPSIIPPLSKSISCVDTFYSAENNTFNISDYCASYPSPFINITLCNQYVLQNTVLCLYLNYYGSPRTLAVTKDTYRGYLSQTIGSIYGFKQYSEVISFFNESSSFFYVKWNITASSDNSTYSLEQCYCVEDGCNQNLSTCLAAKTPVPTTSCATSKFAQKFFERIILPISF